MIKRVTFLFFLLFAATFVRALAPLERSVSIRIYQSRIEDALKEIAAAGNFSFSYNPNTLPKDRRISLDARQKPVRHLLDQIFDGSFSYKNKGEYIILKPEKKPPVPKENKPVRRVIRGYVSSAGTGEKIAYASIFDSISLVSTLTNAHGLFELDLSAESQSLHLFIKKADYFDTTVRIDLRGFQTLDITLHPFPPPEPKPILVPDTTASDSILVLPLPEDSIARFRQLTEDMRQRLNRFGFLVNEKFKNASLNVNDTFFRRAQFSLVPPLSTNRLLSGSVVNDYSFNLLGGYSQGVKVMEVGGLFNIDRGDVGVVQLGGVCNLVGGDVRGFQGGGVFNVVGKDLYGFQGAGVFNLVERNVLGFQASGVFNLAPTVKGGQAAGLFNVAEHMSGIQTAGLFNVAEHMSGVQAAGLFNITDTMAGIQVAGIFNGSEAGNGGVQVAGIFNLAGHPTHVQIAGIFNEATVIRGGQISAVFNRADAVEGIQVAGLLNIAGTVNGSQIGLLNFSDSLHGMGIGLLNFSRKGYHKLELGSDELFPVRVSFRTGTRRLYNLFTVGSTLQNGGERLFSLGYGWGSSLTLPQRFYLDAELNALHLRYADGYSGWNALTQFYLGLEWQASKKFSLAAGPTANFFVYENGSGTASERFDRLRNHYHIGSGSRPHENWTGWVGWRVSVRFF